MAVSVCRYPIEIFWEKEQLDPIMPPFDTFFNNTSPSPLRGFLQQSSQPPSYVCHRTNQLRDNINKERLLSQQIQKHFKDQMLHKFPQFYCGGSDTVERQERPSDHQSNSQKDISLHPSHNPPFEVMVNVHQCDPENIKVEVKDGFLNVEGRKEGGDGSFTYIRHQRSIPNNISASHLKASLLSDGRLRVRHEQGETKVLSVTREEEEGGIEQRQLKNNPETKETNEHSKTEGGQPPN